MKKVATLLLIYLSVAIVMPAVAQLGTGCGSVNTSQEKKEPDQNTCPFTTCCCNICTVCYMQEEKMEFTSVLTGTEKIKVEHEVSTSSYINECWHPPEMV